MKRSACFSATIAAAWLLGGCVRGAQAADAQPVYIYLHARITDHVNPDMSEDRLRRLLPMIERYRQAHPEAHVSADVLFSGAVSKAFEERNSRTHIVDFVKDYIRRGVIEAGYDGADEPTYQRRPAADLKEEMNAEDRWRARLEVAEETLTGAVDPLTGAPVAGDGGLKAMQEVFGKASAIAGLTVFTKGATESGRALTRADSSSLATRPTSGLAPEIGGSPELMYRLRHLNTTAIMFGVPDTNPAHLAGFRDASLNFGRIMAPVPDSTPELYFHDGVLHVSEANGAVRLVHGYEGPERIQAVLNGADRSRVQIVHVELGSAQDYLQPEFVKAEGSPLKYAYTHPQNPRLPVDAMAPAAAVAANWAREDALLKWLVEDFYPHNPGSRGVSSADLRRIAPAASGFSVSISDLQAGAADLLSQWGNNTFPPSYFKAGGHYLSLADAFQMLTDALAEWSRTGQLPGSVQVTGVYGPLEVLTGHGPNIGEVSVGSVARVCAGLAPAFHDESDGDTPRNVIPIWVAVDGINLIPSQFLKLMAAAVASPSEQAKLQIRMAYMLGEAEGVYPKGRPLGEVGYAWTIKPAAPLIPLAEPK